MVLGDDPPLVSVQWTGRGTTPFEQLGLHIQEAGSVSSCQDV